MDRFGPLRNGLENGIASAAAGSIERPNNSAAINEHLF
jgi:hypothetical protein